MTFKSPRRRSARAKLSCASSILILTAVLAPASLATAAEVEDETAASVDEIVVTGSVIQSRAEISARRSAVAIIDTLSRDDIGALPDVTIADSMRRIVGVTTVYNDDIGQFASIRGLHPDFVPVTMNGLTLATTGDLGEGTRKVNLQVLPGEAVSQIQAFKTLSPDLDAGALGGLINLVPLSAYDSAGPQLIATVGASYTNYMDVPDTNSWGDSKSSPWGGLANLMFSRRFGAEDQFGFTGSLNWQSRPRTQTNFATVDRLYFNNAGVATTPESADWAGATTPSQFTTHNYTNKFTQWGGTGRFEYKPTDRLYASLFAFAYYSDEQESRNTNRLFSFDQPKNLTDTTGSVRVKSADTQWRYNTFERDQRGLQGNVKLAVGERGEVSANLGYSYARFLSDRPFVSFLYKPNTRVSYDLSNWRNPVAIDNAAAYLNPANYLLSTTYRDLRHAVEHVWDGRVDYSFNAEKDDRGFGFAVGADYRNLDLRRDITSTNYKAGTLRMTGYGLDPESFSAPGYFQPALWVDPDAFWNSAAVPGLFDAVASADASGIGDYRYQEDIYAAYANAVYSTEHLDLQGGLRLDHVSFDATMASVKNGVLQATPATKSNKDTHLLPSVTAVYSFNPKIRLKAAVSRTLGRPNPETIATVEDIDATDFTIVRGNPDIKPRRATNFDLGGEYYFNQGKGMVTLTGFYKDIQDDILTITSTETIDGSQWFISQPINGEGTKYKGVEFAFINSSFGNIHPTLEAVGASFNIMWVKGETGYTFNGQHRVRHSLQYQPEYSANAAIFYGFGEGSEVRLAYNRQGQYLEEFGASPWNDLVSPAFGTLDLTVKYAVTPNLRIGLEGRNILGADRFRNVGLNSEYERARLEIGNAWFLRFTYLR